MIDRYQFHARECFLDDCNRECNAVERKILVSKENDRILASYEANSKKFISTA